MNKFAIETKIIITPADMSYVRNLYMPLVGVESVALFQAFVDYNAFSQNTISYFAFKDLEKLLDIKSIDLHKSRMKLEAVGLIRTFEKADGVNAIIRINKPLSVSEFKMNKLLFNQSINVIGEEAFERFEYANKQTEYNKDDFSEVSAKYQDLFDINATKKKTVTANTLEFETPSMDTVEDAIKGLPSAQFVYFLTNKKISNSVHSSISHLQNIGLKDGSLNEIINYSFNVNGKVVSNHVLTIGNDFVLKNKVTHKEIKDELFVAFNSKTSQIDEPTVKEQEPTINSGETLEWDELFDSLGEL